VNGKWVARSYPVGDFSIWLDLEGQQVTAVELSSGPIWLEGTYSDGHHYIMWKNTNCNETSTAKEVHMAQYDELDMTTLEATITTCIIGGGIKFKLVCRPQHCVHSRCTD